MTMTTDEAIDDVDATVRIEDGAITIATQETGTLRVETPERRPLSAREPHLTLRADGPEFRAVFDLDADGLDALADALDSVRESTE